MYVDEKGSKGRRVWESELLFAHPGGRGNKGGEAVEGWRMAFLDGGV